MERILLYLDDLDDAVFALAFVGERRGRRLGRVLGNVLLIATLVIAVLLTPRQPAISAGTLALVSVILLYRSVTRPVAAARR
ncbi:MAG: hypothetical protein R3315_12640 [Woeseiaceae bacterium]|nr:hypothetical protein [Woeseiaceae bacterium]